MVRRVARVALLASLTACAAPPPRTGRPAAPSAADSSTTLLRFCNARARAVCRIELTSAVQANIHGTPERCVTSKEWECQTTFASDVAPLADTTVRACETQLATAEHPMDMLMAEARCLPPGPLAAGAACRTDHECATLACEGRALGCGRCAATRRKIDFAEGESCQKDCGLTRLSCVPTGGPGAKTHEGRCTRETVNKIGEACTGDSCGMNGHCIEQRCVGPLAEGAACDDEKPSEHPPCDRGLVCDAKKCAKRGRAAPGEACSRSADCSVDVCDQGKCKKSPAPGDACAMDAQCGHPLQCLADRCGVNLHPPKCGP